MERTDVPSTIGTTIDRDVISIPERGHVDIPLSIWEKLESTLQLRYLLERGIMSVSLLPGQEVRLHGSCYVGKAICQNYVLEFKEKINGALNSLLAHATHSAFRIENASTPASELGDLAALLVNQFLTAVTKYVFYW